MKVLALVPYPLGRAPGQRYRIEQWAPYLAEHGIHVTFAPFADAELGDVLYRPGLLTRKSVLMLRGLLHRARDARSAAGFDAVLVHREASLIGPAWAERLAKRRQPRFVYDFDDAVWVPYVSPTNRYLSLLKFPGKTRTICRLSSTVLAGNQHLADWARQYASDVQVVPSTVALRDYPARPERDAGSAPVVGWTGSHSSLQYLRQIEGPLRALRRRTAFRLVVIGVTGFEVPGLEVECRPWNPATEARDLWDFDVGIMPLPDESWARGKCGMKAIQYMAVGVPAVVSPVGANRTIVQHGVDGFHASSEVEWQDAIARLLGDRGLQRSMGAAARNSVKARFSAEVQVPRVASVFRRLTGAQP